MPRWQRQYQRKVKLYDTHPFKWEIERNGLKWWMVAALAHMTSRELCDYLNGYKYMSPSTELKIKVSIELVKKDTPDDVKRILFRYLFPDAFKNKKD